MKVYYIDFFTKYVPREKDGKLYYGELTNGGVVIVVEKVNS